MWKYVGVNVEGIIGVPATDLTDEEFAKYNAKVNAQHSSDQRGALANSGLYEHVEDKPSRKPAVTTDKVDEVTTTANTATVESKDEKKDD